jgi:uncharacterized protein YlaI
MKRSPLRRCSKKHAKELETYRVLRLSYLSEHQFCEMDGCGNRANQIHHKEKRGKNLNNIDTWMALCPDCHTKIEDNKSWARENNLLK